MENILIQDSLILVPGTLSDRNRLHSALPAFRSPLIKSHSSSVVTFEGTENGVSATEYLNRKDMLQSSLQDRLC